MPRIALAVFAVAVIVYALIDCARTDSSRMPIKLSKPLWLLAIILLPGLGALLWLGFKVARSGALNKTISTDSFDKFKNPGQKKPTGPVAPDDDPDFLARLDAQNRRKAYEEKRHAEEEAEAARKAEERERRRREAEASDDGTDPFDEPGLN